MSWEVWGIIALCCIALEFMTVDFSFLMIAGGAFVAAGVSAGTDSLVAQVAAFAVVSVLLLAIVRPWAKNHFNPKGTKVGTVQDQIGKRARALTVIDENAGRVKIGGDVWSSRSAGGVIPEGSDVVVTDIEGVVAIVVQSAHSSQ